MKFLRTFFGELEDRDEIGKSPFRKLGSERRKTVMKTTYDDPVFLRKDELKAVLRYTMLELKDRFALMCAAFGEEQYMVGEDLEILDK